MKAQQYHPQLSVLSASLTPRIVSRLVTLFVWLFVLLPIVMLFLPWQQNISATGYVSAYTPAERRQTVQAPVSGRIQQWFVKEGAKVAQGDLLLEISDIDPQLFRRLNQQKMSSEAKLVAKQQELDNYQLQIERLETVRDMKVSAAEYKLDMTGQKVRAARESLAAKQASYETAQQQRRRLQRLLADGLVSERDFELADRDAKIASRSLNSAQASLQSAVAERHAAESDINQYRADVQAKIDSTSAKIKKNSGEMQDIRNNLLDYDVKISRQSAQRVYAPQSGHVLKQLMNPQGNIVKQGDPLLILVPYAGKRAVEVWVSGNDAPLIQPGHRVRLMFEGWPAVQFVGWTEVAVGTFGGTVSFVDASDNGKGKFRILIVPDESDHLWPSNRFLRQGSAVKAWILLEQVTIGYEIWRVLNGFPPSLTEEHPNNDLSRPPVKKL